MRLTVLGDDPGVKIESYRERYKVFLDGIEVKNCFTSDDEKGEVIIAMTNDQGRMQAEGGKVKRQTLYGKVQMERIQ
ncbi:hypothetical protein XK97_14775 [Obesumbacterium proteus]|uniref:hypothetical protein n=1 Tax=Obesumbacterium proteus TaxID=82983 RepID=UPI0006212051|nr:hypothetical protein [Obesumbacterium proteus]KKI44233.1 hypothetical protein XK97_14775 [Obesumbacterium proteus]